MGKPPKRRVQGSRITPKGTAPVGQSAEDQKRDFMGRQFKAPSPWWVSALLFGFLGVGAVIIVINYLGYVPGGDASNIYLLVGLGFILAGMITATQLR